MDSPEERMLPVFPQGTREFSLSRISFGVAEGLFTSTVVLSPVLKEEHCRFSPFCLAAGAFLFFPERPVALSKQGPFWE